MFCDYCKKRGHYEDVCYVRDPSKCKTQAQRESAQVKTEMRKIEERKAQERRKR